MWLSYSMYTCEYYFYLLQVHIGYVHFDFRRKSIAFEVTVANDVIQIYADQTFYSVNTGNVIGKQTPKCGEHLEYTLVGK